MKTTELSPKAISQIKTAVGEIIDDRLQLFLFTVRDELEEFLRSHDDRNFESKAELTSWRKKYGEYKAEDTERFMDDVSAYIFYKLHESKPDATEMGSLFFKIAEKYRQIEKDW
jgi:hypothetical protein